MDTRVAALLEAPLGCTFLLIAHASGLTPAAVAEPAVSVLVAAVAAREINVWRLDHDTVGDEVLHRGKQHAGLARAILEQPTAAWWFGPLDTEHQLWLSRTGTAPTPTEFGAASLPLSDWERYAQKSARGLYTSTLTGGTSSVLASIYEGAGDLDYPLLAACWKLTAPASVRVFEIDGALVWHDLCVRHPAQGSDGRLVPDWNGVALIGMPFTSPSADG